MSRTRRGRSATACLTTLLLLAATAAPAEAAPSTKYYSATPASIVASTTSPAVVGLGNCKPCDGRTSTQPFGSAEVRFTTGAGLTGTGATVTSPGSAWTVTVTFDGTDTVLRLTNPGPGTTYAVQPGQSVRVSIPVAGSATGKVPLQTQVKQSNDFSGVGNDVTRVGPDPVVYVGAGPPASLEFVTGPSSVQVSSSTAAVSGTGLSPVLTMCAPPVVRVLDAAGRPVTWLPATVVSLSSPGAGVQVDGTVRTSAGVATFGAVAAADGSCTPSSGDGSVSATALGRGRTLTASGTFDGAALSAAASRSFDVLPSFARCPGSCSTDPVTSTGTTAKVAAALPAGSTSSAAALSFGVGFDTWSAFTGACNPEVGVVPGELNPYRTPVTVDLSDHDKSVSLRWSKKAVQWATNNGSSQWGVCMAASYSFPTAGGADATAVGAWFVGALPRCGDVATGWPCIASLTRQGGEQLATVSLPDREGDPRMI